MTGKDIPITNEDETRLQVEITPHKMIHLLSEGHVSAMDFQCLNRQSKEYLRQLCLLSCMNNPLALENVRFLNMQSRQQSSFPRLGYIRRWLQGVIPSTWSYLSNRCQPCLGSK